MSTPKKISSNAKLIANKLAPAMTALSVSAQPRKRSPEDNEPLNDIASYRAMEMAAQAAMTMIVMQEFCVVCTSVSHSMRLLCKADQARNINVPRGISCIGPTNATVGTMHRIKNMNAAQST
jgi:hypothetical protein